MLDTTFSGDLISALAGGLAGAFAAGYIGYKAAISAATKTDELEERRAQERAQLLYRMLRSEIDYDLELLKKDKEWLDPAQSGYPAYQWMALNPSPQWARVVWENSVGELAKALTETEMKGVHGFYESLQSLAFTREQMSRINVEAEQAQLYTPTLFSRADALMSSILQAGNPLKRP